MSQGKPNDFSHMLFQEKQEKKYALVVGVNAAAHLPSVAPLRYAESDARGLGWLLARETCNFAFPSAVMTGPEASAQAVRQAVIHLLEHQDQDDLLLFYFTGHSYPVFTSRDETEIYLVTSDFDPQMAQRDPSAYLSLRWLRRMFLEQNTAANVMLILDCSFAGNIWNTADIQQPEQPQRSWAILASAAANTPAYEVSNRRGEGHAAMTGLILDALNGTAPTALDSAGNVTLLSLYSYVQQQMAEQESASQRPLLRAYLARPWILAHHPAQNPIITNVQEVTPSLATRHFFDEAICPTATFADLDNEQIRAFLQQERVLLQDDYQTGPDEQAQLEALGLLQGEHPSYAALLCFGHRPAQWLAGAYTRCIYWKDAQRLSGWFDDREYRGSLLQQFTQALNFLQKHLNFSRSIERGGSHEQPEIPFRVLEEALANALVHREYVTEPGKKPRAEGVVVEIFHDRIEISNPGNSLVPIEILQDASKQHPGSHPRNPQIMRIFYLANHVERIGTGLARIQEGLREAKLPHAILTPNPRTQAFTITVSRPVLREYIYFDWEHAQPTNTSMARTTALLIPSVDPTAPTTDLLMPPANSARLVKSTQSMLRLRSSRFLLILLALILIMGGVGANVFGLGSFVESTLHPTASPASTTIEIASDFPMSGLNTVTDLPLQNGVQMAVADANHDGLLPGYTLKLFSYDDVGKGSRPDPQVGAANVRNAIADNLIAGIVGPSNSTVATAELPIANQAPIALISPNVTYPCLTKSAISDPNDCVGVNDIQAQMRPTGQLTFFRLATTDEFQGKAEADYFYTTLHYHKVLILNDYSDLYSSGLASAFQREWTAQGGQAIPLALSEAQSSVQDYLTALQNAVSDQPDLIYFAGDDPNGTYVLQALASIPAFQHIALAGGDGIVDNDFLMETAILHPNAPIYASLPIQDPAHTGTTVGSNFQQNYTASGYSNYRAYAASAYDCTMMLIQAIKVALQKVSTPHGANDAAGAKRFRLAVLQALAHLTYTGATGTHSFDANGDITNPTISFYQLDLSNIQTSWRWLMQIDE